MVLPQVSKSENLREVGNKIRYYREKKKINEYGNTNKKGR